MKWTQRLHLKSTLKETALAIATKRAALRRHVLPRTTLISKIRGSGVRSPHLPARLIAELDRASALPLARFQQHSHSRDHASTLQNLALVVAEGRLDDAQASCAICLFARRSNHESAAMTCLLPGGSRAVLRKLLRRISPGGVARLGPRCRERVIPDAGRMAFINVVLSVTGLREKMHAPSPWMARDWREESPCPR